MRGTVAKRLREQARHTSEPTQVHYTPHKSPLEIVTAAGDTRTIYPTVYTIHQTGYARDLRRLKRRWNQRPRPERSERLSFVMDR